MFVCILAHVWIVFVFFHGVYDGLLMVLALFGIVRLRQRIEKEEWFIRYKKVYYVSLNNLSVIYLCANFKDICLDNWCGSKMHWRYLNLRRKHALVTVLQNTTNTVTQYVYTWLYGHCSPYATRRRSIWPLVDQSEATAGVCGGFLCKLARRI